MPTDDDLDGRIAATARSAFDQVQRSIDPELEYEAFRRRLSGAALIELGATPIHRRKRWAMIAAAAVVVVAIAATAVLVGRGSDTDVVAPPPSLIPPPTTEDSTVPATTAAPTTTSPKSTLAEATPSVVAAGEQLTITPANFVERACLDIVTATRRDDENPRVSQILQGRVTASDAGTAVTSPACSGVYSDAGFTFIVPATLPPGPYEMCLTAETIPAACALVEVSPPSQAARACASESFAPPALVDGAPPGEASIDIDANGRSARWGGADATNRVLQILDSAVDPEALDSALATGRAFTAGTFQAAVQAVGDPPLGMISIFLRNTAEDCLRLYVIGPGVFDDEATRTAQSWVEALDAASITTNLPSPETTSEVLDDCRSTPVPPPTLAGGGIPILTEDVLASDGLRYVTWSTNEGTDAITQLLGANSDLPRLPVPDDSPVRLSARGHTIVVIPIGDPGTIRLQIDDPAGCYRVYLIAAGPSMDQAMEFAAGWLGRMP